MRIVLATAADQRIAESIAAHLGIIDEVLTRDGVINLAGKNKLRAVHCPTKFRAGGPS